MRRLRWFTVELLPSARRALAALPPMPRAEVLDAIGDLADDPESPDSLAMTGKGQGLRRFSVGQYRVVYRVLPQRRSVLVLRIGHRSEVYRGLEPPRG